MYLKDYDLNKKLHAYRKATGITNRLHHKIILPNKTSDYAEKVSCKDFLKFSY